MKTKRRIYMKDAALAAGTEITPGKEHAHYLVNVLRLGAGDEVHFFNAQMGEWRGEIGEIKKSSLKIHVRQQTRSPLPSPLSLLTLAFSPLKKDRTDFLVEKASELGVHFLQPIFTDHTQSERVNVERLQLTAIEAAEQCDRLDAPTVLPPVKLSAYLSALPKDATAFLAAESGEAVSVAQAFSLPGVCQTHGPAQPIPLLSSPIHFIIGPEGGFSAAEFESFARAGQIRPIRLGARLLRAETAAVAVLAAFQAVAGDWR